MVSTSRYTTDVLVQDIVQTTVHTKFVALTGLTTITLILMKKWPLTQISLFVHAVSWRNVLSVFKEFKRRNLMQKERRDHYVMAKSKLRVNSHVRLMVS